MVVLRSCCCGCTLEFGTKVIAIFGLISAFFGLFSAPMSVDTYEYDYAGLSIAYQALSISIGVIGNVCLLFGIYRVSCAL